MQATGSTQIGILGGTFDPVHQGHIYIAKQAYQHLGLDAVQFVPSFQPVHKHSDTKSQHRAEMLALAVATLPWATVNLLEYQRGGKSYTIDTVRALQEEMPEAHFYLLIGEDSLYTLPTWHQWQTLLQRVKIAVIPRTTPQADLPSEVKAVLHTDKAMFLQAAQGVYVLPSQPMDLSSTAIRKQLQQGELPAQWLPEAVAQYIQSHHLYRN